MSSWGATATRAKPWHWLKYNKKMRLNHHRFNPDWWYAENRDISPEQNLWLETIKYSLYELRWWYRASSSQRKKDEMKWLTSDDMYVGSFLWCCEALELSPKRILGNVQICSRPYIGWEKWTKR